VRGEKRNKIIIEKKKKEAVLNDAHKLGILSNLYRNGGGGNIIILEYCSVCMHLCVGYHTGRSERNYYYYYYYCYYCKERCAEAHQHRFFSQPIGQAAIAAADVWKPATQPIKYIHLLLFITISYNRQTRVGRLRTS